MAKLDMIGGWPSGAIVEWQYTDPVTGSKGESGITREYSPTTEFDSFGSDVTYPPPPPDPATYELPIYAGPVGQTYYQIEGGPTDDYGVSSSYLQAVQNSIDRGLAEHFFSKKNFDAVKEILERNPNVGVVSRHFDREGNLIKVGFRWGQEAANFIYGIGREILANRLINVNDDKKYSVTVGYILNRPQETEQDLNEGQREIVKDIVGTARYYLDNKPECFSFIQGGTKADPSKVLDQLQTSNIKFFNGVQFEGSEAESDITVAAARGGRWANSLFRGGNYSWDKTNRIVLGHAYFRDPFVAGMTTKYNLDLKQTRVMVMLHELKHVISQIGHPRPDPGTGSTSSAVWNQNILDKCLK